VERQAYGIPETQIVSAALRTSINPSLPTAPYPAEGLIQDHQFNFIPGLSNARNLSSETGDKL
jgi:hypothetical protein